MNTPTIFPQFLPLTAVQQDIYFDQLHYVDVPLYNVGGYIALPAIDPARLKWAHHQLVTTNDVFGMRMISSPHGVQQFIAEERDCSLPLLDFSEAADPTTAAADWLNAHFRQPMSVELAPLFSAHLLKLSDQCWYYVGKAHHLCMDGWGFANWARHLNNYYQAQQMPLTGKCWSEVVQQDQDYRDSARYQADRQYWQERLQELPEHLFQPNYMHQHEGRHCPAQRQVLHIPRERSAAVAALANELQVPVAQLYHALTAIYFSRCYQQTQLLFGCPVHNRSTKLDKSSLGVFVSVIPVLLECSAEITLADLCRQIGQKNRQNYKHQRFPVGEMFRNFIKEQGRERLYDIGYNYLRLDSRLEFDGQPAHLVYLSHQHEQNPLMLTIWEYGDTGQVEIQADYNLMYFDSIEIKRMLSRFELLLDEVLRQPLVPICSFTLLPQSELQLLEQWSKGPDLHFDPQRLARQLFETQVMTAPDKIALVCREQQLSYFALNQHANQLAHRLLALQLPASAFVGIHCRRSAYMVIAVLAAIKAGLPFVALDPDYPSQRLRYIVDDCQVAVVLSQTDLLELWDDTAVTALALDNNFGAYATENPPDTSADASQIAYCIYTSGSTGQPKGVLIRQSNLLALLHWARQTYSDEQLRSVLASTSLNFDLSMFELFVPLCFGFQIVLVRNPLALLEQVVDVSLINTVPSAARALLQAKAVPASVNTVNLAGEPLPATIVNELLQTTSCQTVYNLYGPSEDTTYSTWACFTAPIARMPEIGKVIAGSQAYVLSATQEPVPTGCIGELYLGGAGVAAGYQGKLTLTAERFIELSGERGLCYRTGDLVRYLPDGALAYLGRADEQVKLRGFRIEPGEIEHCLLMLPEVTQAVVVVVQQRLVAYLVASQEDADSIRAQLAVQLPAHMVPEHLMFLSALPLTPNGKINKKMLPSPETAGQVGPEGLPQNDTERQLAVLVASVLRQQVTSVSMSQSFFGSGGDSLSAVALLSQIETTFAVSVSLHQVFSGQSLRQLASLIMAGGAPTATIIPAASGLAAVPTQISLLQQRLWLLHQVQGTSASYHMPFALRFRDVVEPALVQQALLVILQRHPILRSVYQADDAAVWLRPQEATAFQLEFDEVNARNEQMLAELLATKSAVPFDLAVELPFRAGLINWRYTADQAPTSILWICVHHLALDGLSVAILLRELEQVWLAQTQGLSLQLPEPVLQYHDYARWQHQQLAIGAFNSHREYWRTQLTGAPLRHSLPVNPAHSTSGVGVYRTELPLPLVQRLRQAGKRNEMTLFMQLHAALALLLSRASNCQDLLIATAVSNRPSAQLVETIGFFVNTVILRANTAQPDISHYLQHIRLVHQAARQHQDLPFDLVVAACEVPRDSNYLPLSQILLTYQEWSPATTLKADGPMSWYPLAGRQQKYELEVDITVNEESATVCWGYQSGLFAAELIGQLGDNYLVLLEQLAAAQLPGGAVPTSAPLHQLSGMSDSERNFLLHRLNDNSIAYDQQVTLAGMFTQQAQLTPDQIVLQIAEQCWSYAELNQMANGLANQLFAAGVGPGSLVAVSCRRDITMVVAVLAVLKAGAGYVPVDPAYPLSRQQHIVTASQVALLLTNDGVAEKLQVAQRMMLSAETIERLNGQQVQTPATSGEDIAYVIYTSGSTGQPKGVAIRHRSAVALLRWAQLQYSNAELQQVLASTSLSFDLSVFELFVPLCLGYRCVLVENALTLLTTQPVVTLLNTVPSAVRTLLEEAAIPSSVKVINLAGEPLQTELLNQLLNSGVSKVCNLYGPTEDTTYSTCAEFVQPITTSPVIGKVLNNSQAYILSAGQELLPFGVAGELYLAGAGLAVGYMGQPALSAEKFIHNPYAAGLLYRTGDLVRYADRQGNLAFLGRLDDQVKIRGFRLELGEIEHVLLQHDAITEACVLACGDGEQRQLRAFVVALRDSSVLLPQLRAHLTAHLPDYMQPAAITVLATMPLTPNGKTDKSALSRLALSVDTEIVLPATTLETQLRVLWAQVLKIDLATCSVTEQFFQAGGHSLLAVRLSTEISRTLQLACSPQLIFQYPTIRLLATQLSTQSAVTQLIPVCAEVQHGSPLSFAQQRIWFLTQLAPDDDAYNLSATLHVYGDFQASLLPQALAALIQRQQILQYRFVLQSGEPVLVRDESSVIACTMVDLTQMSPTEQHDQILRLRHEQAAYRFDLQHEVLMRLTYIKTADATTVAKDEAEPSGLLLLSMHHLICDGGAIPLLLNDFLTAYRALCQGESCVLPALPVHYVDFCHWQRARFDASYLQQQTDYWQQLLADAPPAHRLPLASARGAEPVRGAQLEQVLPTELCHQLAEQLQQNHVTLFMLLQAALALHVGRLSHDDDVVIGAPVDGRQHYQLQPLVGLLLNTTLYRTEFGDNPTWSTLLQRTREQHIRSLPFQDVPFEAIVERINPVRDLQQSPLFQILLNYHNTELPTLDLPNGHLQLQVELTQNAKYDLTLYVQGDTECGIRLHWAYNEALFSRDTMQFYASEFVHLLSQICVAPHTAVLNFSWLHRPQWPVVGNEPIEDYQIWQLIGQQVRCQPDMPALSYGDVQYSYRELDMLVNQLANYLLECGFAVGQRVAVLTQRHTQRVISILALLKAGGAYVPLSQELPENRLIYMLNQAAPALLLTDSTSQQDYPSLVASYSGTLVCLDAPQAMQGCANAPTTLQAQARQGSDEAHIIFTSGSTGLPKGVSGTCAATHNRVRWMLDAYPYQSAEPVAHITSMAFIRGVWELLVPLCGGAHLILCDRAIVRDTALLWDWLKQRQISRLVTAPSLMKALTDLVEARQETQLMPLRYWFVSGEPLLQQHANAVLQQFPWLRLFNLYGSTEVMSDVLVKELTLDLRQQWVSLGTPISGVGVCILANDGLPAPAQVVGEIAVLGAAVANGYLADHKHPAFIETSAGRMYKTGDLGICDASGEFTCFGRRDDQIKIRGYRIEPGEIRAVLSRHPAVLNCFVRPWQHGEQQLLLAYVVATEQADQQLLREQLGELVQSSLPIYMHPTAYVFVAALPLRPNGKVDRQALPAPDLGALQLHREPPANVIEHQLCQLWGELLRLDAAELGVTSCFFALGGHSLLVTQLSHQLQQRFGLVLTYQEFFANSTIRYQANRIAQLQQMQAVLQPRVADSSQKILL